MTAQPIESKNKRPNTDNHSDYRGDCQPLEYVQGTSLTRDHIIQLFVQRGLDFDWVVANCRSLTAKEASKHLEYTAKSDGILLKGANNQVQFRPDVPWESKDKNGKITKPKYRSPLGDYDVMLPAHPNNPDYWNDLEALKKQCFVIDGHPCLIVTEGMFKAISGCSNGIPTVALLGVTVGLTPSKKDPKGQRYLVPQLRKFAEAGFGFIFAFDADIISNKSVKIAEKKLKFELKVANSNTYSVSGLWQIEKGKGMDDYIKNNGADDFKEEILAKALSTEAWEKQFCSEDGDDESDSPSKSRSKYTSKKAATEVAERFKHEWAYHNEQQTWRRFNGKVWEAVHENVFAQIVLQSLETIYPEYENYSFLESVVKLVKLQLLVPTWQTFPRHQWIAFNNKVLNIETGELHDHAPGFRFTNYLPRDYSPIVADETLDTIAQLNNHCPNFYKWVMDAMEGDAQKVYKLLAIINGVIGFKFFDWQMFVHLVGKPGSGKGTFARILEKLCGEENTKSSRLPKLSVDTEVARIINAQLVICSDEDKKVGEHGQLKAMTGGDKISYREIYKQGAESYFYGALMVISNSPVFSGDTSGLDRRLCMVRFDNPIPAHRRSSAVEKAIEAELSALTSVVLSMDDTGVTEAVKGIGSAHIPAFRVHEWSMKCQTDTLAAFIDERLIYSPGDAIHVDDLFKPYLAHVSESNAKGAYKLQTFSPRLLELTNWLEWDCEKKRHAHGVKIWGIRLRTDADDHTPYVGETLLPVSVDQCRPSVDPDVDLKPSQGKDSVDHVDLKPIHCDSQQLTLDAIASTNPEPASKAGGSVPIENVGLEPTQSTLPAQGKGFGSTLSPTPGLHGSTSGQDDSKDDSPVKPVRVPQEPVAPEQPLKVGDRVTWDNCYPHLLSWSPFTIASIDGDSAMLDVLSHSVPLSELEKVD